MEKAIIAASPDLELTIDDVVINNDGSAVITKDGKEYFLAQGDNVIEDLKYSVITEVDNTNNLSDNEKIDVERAARKANPNLAEGTTISVGDDGTVIVNFTDGRPAATIAAKNAVIKSATKDITPPDAPKVVANKDGTVTVTPPNDVDLKSMYIKYTPEGSYIPVTITAPKDDYGNWSLPDDCELKIVPICGVVTITADKVEDKTEVTTKAKDQAENISAGEGKAIAKTTGDASQETGLKDPARVAVKDPENLSDDEKVAIKDTVNKANPSLKDKQIVVDKEGNATVSIDGQKAKIIAKDKTVSTDLKVPTLTEVANLDNLTEDEKTSIKEEVKKVNTDLIDDQVEVKDDEK